MAPRNKDQYPNAEVDNRVTVMRIDAPIYFANVEYILDFVRSGHLKVRQSALQISWSKRVLT